MTMDSKEIIFFSIYSLPPTPSKKDEKNEFTSNIIYFQKNRAVTVTPFNKLFSVKKRKLPLPSLYYYKLGSYETHALDNYTFYSSLKKYISGEEINIVITAVLFLTLLHVTVCTL